MTPTPDTPAILTIPGYDPMPGTIQAIADEWGDGDEVEALTALVYLLDTLTQQGYALLGTATVTLLRH